MAKYLHRNDVIRLLKKRQGSRTAKELAAELAVSPALLSEIYSGTRNPGETILMKLGLRSCIVYQKIA